MEPAKSRACGFLYCYNEEAVIRETLNFYLRQGIDLVIFDNDSTDSTIDIINGFFREKDLYAGRVLDLIRIATKRYEWEAILRQANDYMHKNLSHYEWILNIDADTHYSSPVRSLSLLAYLGAVKKRGYNIIHGRSYYFYPTEKDDHSIASYSERIKYFRFYNFIPQEKIFLYHPTVNFYAKYGHWCFRDNRCTCINPGFILKHYIWVSYEQGLKKIFKERKPRYLKKFPIQEQYIYMLPLEKDFIKDSKTLEYYRQEHELISTWQFFWISKLVFIYGALFVKIKKIILLLKGLFKNIISHKVKKHAGVSDDSYAASHDYNSSPGHKYAARDNFRRIPQILKKIIKAVMPDSVMALIKSVHPYSIETDRDYFTLFNLIDRLIPPNLATSKTVNDLPPFYSYPSEYHFLMTSFCNARCIFCNQLNNKPKKEITLDAFKAMLSHISIDDAQRFYFSGGGETLLCQDLFEIIKYVNRDFPHIKIRLVTNGLLIGKYAENIAKSDIEQLIVSVHGTREINNSILQVENSQDIFKGLSLLQKYQEQYGKKIYKVFYTAVSRINVNEIPKLIKKAAELKIDEVSAAHCKYYSHRVGEKLKTEDSLFFHKEIYNALIRQSVSTAKKLGVNFSHVPLFFKKYKEERCCQPWYLLLVDSDGDVYPCTGGEVLFYQKVKSGSYRFGNLLKQDISEFWFDELYIKLRRHLLACYAERHIPECDRCHNIGCFKGPGLKSAHIMALEPSC